MTVGFRGFRETFITDVDARRSELAIDVSLVRGPFRKLSNAWRFQPIATGTRVDFSIAFEFRNFVLQALADANKIVCGRARDRRVRCRGRPALPEGRYTGLERRLALKRDQLVWKHLSLCCALVFC